MFYNIFIDIIHINIFSIKVKKIWLRIKLKWHVFRTAEVYILCWVTSLPSFFRKRYLLIWYECIHDISIIGPSDPPPLRAGRPARRARARNHGCVVGSQPRPALSTAAAVAAAPLPSPVTRAGGERLQLFFIFLCLRNIVPTFFKNKCSFEIFIICWRYIFLRNVVSTFLRKCEKLLFKHFRENVD
jgi:hypothetical protein